VAERPTEASTDPLVVELATRLRHVDLVAWARIAAKAERFELSFADLRLLLALTMRDGPTSVGELADLSGLSLDAAYPAIHGLHGRGYVRDERRRYSLTEEGRELVGILDAAHREGIQAYVARLDPAERARLEDALGVGG
jgi:DNA-binding MarR family transcriptional regulator